MLDVFKVRYQDDIKTNISQPQICTRMSAYQGLRSGSFDILFVLKTLNTLSISLGVFNCWRETPNCLLDFRRRVLILLCQFFYISGINVYLHPIFNCSKSTVEISERCVETVQS